MGAEVAGYAFAPEQDDDLFAAADVGALCPTTYADIRDAAGLAAAMQAFAPQTVFHMAAQPLVRRSYADPLETFSTNVLGTSNLLEAARRSPGLESVVVVATDKCYRNREWDRGYRESDELGGSDPYSASKAAAELVVESYRASFLAKACIGLASVRGGNVIGGGDWSVDRLTPDIVRAFRRSEELVLRNPNATRPWQHVLDCLNGYLIVAEALAADPAAVATAWNIGPSLEGEASVGRMVERLARHMPVRSRIADDPQPHEAALLALDSTQARERLGWRPLLDFDATVDWTAQWYREYLDGVPALDLVQRQIVEFEALLGHGSR